MKLRLPWPPTVNHIWKSGKGKTYLSKKGRDWYTRAVYELLSQQPETGIEARVFVRVDLYPPNRRRWDLDNRTKCVLDVLTRAGILVDDEQVDELHLKRHPPDEHKQGYAVVQIETL